MNSRQRRVRVIELTLEPKQIVALWLRTALQAGTFLEGGRGPRSPREMIADSVYDAVQNSMKGQEGPLVQRAILQAQKEADLLYNLIVTANSAVLQNSEQIEREHFFLLAYMTAEMRGNPSKGRIDDLRSAILMFIEPVIVIDAAIAQVVAEWLTGQPVLFRDSAAILAELLQMATHLLTCFNHWAIEVDAAEINLEELRAGLQEEADRKVDIWVNLGRMEMLYSFGKGEEMQAAMDEVFRLVESESSEANNVVLK